MIKWPKLCCKRRRVLKRAAIVPFICIALFGAMIAWGQATLNFHAIVPGEFYRSGQPTAEEIDEVVKEHGIRTIINLRGENTGQPWYDDEMVAVKAAGVKHIDFRMTSKRELTEAQARELIALMRKAPKPLWVHCRGGADRTGLASALYLGAVKGKSADAVWGQLAPIYGHVSLPVHAGYSIDRSLTNLAPLWQAQ